MNAFISLARADWGPAFRATAGRVAYVVAVAIVAAEMAWRAGQATGRALHWLNDTLAGLASGRIDRAATARAAVRWARATLAAPAPAPAPAPVAVTMAYAPAAPTAPAAGLPPPAIESLTVRELRAMARARGIAGMGRARRADLICAITSIREE